MTATRVVLGVLGAALIGVGVYEVWPLVLNLDMPSFSLVAWALGGTVLHDFVLVPVISVLAVGLGRLLPVAWRAPVVIGGVLSGVLALLAIPLLWREYGGAQLPGLHDRNYLTGLLIWLALIWLTVLITALIRSRKQSNTHP